MVTSFYPPYHVGGACVHVYHLANALAEKGHIVHVVFSKEAYNLKRKGQPSSKDYPNHENIRLFEIESPVGRLAPVYSYVTGLPASLKVRAVLKQNYDIIHYHNISLMGPIVLRLGDAPKIYTAHDHWLFCPYNDYFTGDQVCGIKPASLPCALDLLKNKRPPQLWRFTNTLRNALRSIDLVLSPSQYLESFLMKNGLERPVSILPNFVLNPPDDVPDLAEEDFFFYAGMLEEIKGISSLLKVFQRIDRKLVIAGNGSLQDSVKRAAANRRNISYVGWLERKKLYSYYTKANAFILASRCPENSPLTVLESYSVGTPALGSDIGGIPEIIGEVDRNLLFQPGDIDEIAEKITSFSRYLYDKAQIKKHFYARFSSNHYVDRYLQLVEGVLENSGRI